MSEEDISSYLKELGCCDTCCLRYQNIRNPNSYEKFQNLIEEPSCSTNGHTIDKHSETENQNGQETDLPPAKRKKWQICASCLGVLQVQTWQECFDQVKEHLDKKRYECPTFACALSYPIAILLREKTISLMLLDKFKDYDINKITPLKEAWKWTFGVRLAKEIDKSLDSGAVSPLLITVNLEYPDDLEELEPLKTVSPQLFEERSRQKKRFAVEFTRRSVEQALDGVTLEALQRCKAALPVAACCVKCVSVVCTHAPLYLGGRYIKLSRNLPQSPWILEGKRMLESSVQEIIFQPIATQQNISQEDVDHRLKFLSSGREDVDVRCLGNGRPFAIEISDPRRNPTEEELKDICELITKDGRVVVKSLKIIDKDDLTRLKQGEETKCKTYEALCVKLADDKHGELSTVTAADIEKINSLTNDKVDDCRMVIEQKTPIRVLHRRPLLTRKRKILELEAKLVPDHPQYFTVKVRTEAGTYIKEWVHGELGRSKPSLADILGSKVDILALDVASVDLDWP